MAGKALDKKNNVVEIGYDVDVSASSSVEWENDESPTGWNHSRDEPTYTSYVYAVAGDVTVESVSFTQDSEFYINGNAYSLRDAQTILGPNVFTQLLNPQVYVKLMGSSFDKQAENIEQPEPDYDEPERDYDDY